MSTPLLAVWFLAIRTGTGTDVFTRQLAEGLRQRGIPAEISWLPLRAEFLPWFVARPLVPEWATVVHVNSWLHARFLPADLAVVSTSHLCVHDDALLPYKSWHQRLYHRYWIRKLEADVFARSARVTAVSAYTADVTGKVFQLPAISTVHNGVAMAGTPASRRFPEARPFRLLFAGSWSRRKGVDMLAEVMTSLGQGFDLLYTSDESQNQAYGLPDNCICVGRMESPEMMQNLYLYADALLFPTRLEGFSLTVIEAMAAGLPVVTTRSSSLPEVVIDGENGFLCELDSASELVTAARKLAGNAELYLRLSARAVQDVSDRFSLDRMIDDYIRVYTSCVDSAS